MKNERAQTSGKQGGSGIKTHKQGNENRSTKGYKQELNTHYGLAKGG